MSSIASTTFVWEHPEFAFYLPGDWRQVPTVDEEQLELYSEQNESRITLSVIPMAIPEQRLPTWADQLLVLRRQAHDAWLVLPENVGKGRTISITNQKIAPLPDNKSIEVSHTGQYTGVSLFGFVGYVTTRKVVNLFCETKISFAPGRAGVFQTVASGFKITLP